MHDFRDYLRAYWRHVRTRGLIKVVGLVLLWVAGMFVPAGARSFVQLPDWIAFSWMISWAIGGYVVTPYGMWKHQRAATINPASPDRN